MAGYADTMSTRSAEIAVEVAALRSDRFRLERENDWRLLDQIVTDMEKGRTSNIADEDVMALPALFRTAVSSLSIARESSLDAALIDYLEGLTLRAYFQVYGTRIGFGGWLRQFFGGGWSRAVRGIAPDLAIAFITMVAGAIVGYWLVASDPDWFYALVPAGFGETRVPGASREVLEQTLFGQSEQQGMAAFATYLFSNNAQVSILAFALGFAFGIPSVLLLIHNMALLGAMLHVFGTQQLTLEFIGWLSIHGTTELLAIMLAGGAGIHIGRSLAFPGDRSHLDAARIAGTRAALVMTGVVLMLIVAGLLEGFARQLVDNTLARYAIGYSILLFWALYFCFAGRKAA